MQAPRYYYPGKKPYRMIYMEDPFANLELVAFPFLVKLNMSASN
jgi:hypothetical protein